MGARAVVCALLLSSAPVRAIEPLVDQVSEYVGVPGDILYAMALTESGRKVGDKVIPWPWTLNVAGEPRRYDDREAMFEDLMRVLGEGTLSVDVGPLQVNWFWQFERVTSPWRLTDPAVSVKLAAEILKSLHARSGDWWTAVGQYYRPSEAPHHQAAAERYRDRVRLWHTRAAAEASVDEH